MDMFFHYLNEVAKWLAVPIFFAAAFLPDSVLGHAYFLYFVVGVAAINMASAMLVYTPLSIIEPVTGSGRFIAFLVTGILVPFSLKFEGLVPQDVFDYTLIGWMVGSACYLVVLFAASE